MQRERETLEYSALKEMSYHILSLSKFRHLYGSGKVEEPEVVDDFKETVLYRHNRADTHMNSQRQ